MTDAFKKDDRNAAIERFDREIIRAGGKPIGSAGRLVFGTKTGEEKSSTGRVFSLDTAAGGLKVYMTLTKSEASVICLFADPDRAWVFFRGNVPKHTGGALNPHTGKYDLRLSAQAGDTVTFYRMAVAHILNTHPSAMTREQRREAFSRLVHPAHKGRVAA